MKHAFLKLTGRKFVTAIFLSAVLLLTSASGNAADIKGNIEILSGEKTNIRFAGSTADALLFNVNINNDKGSNFIITIKNDNGEILFSKSFNDANFNRSFKLLKGVNDGERYYFTITSNDKNLEDSYVITSTARTVEDVAVNKL